MKGKTILLGFILSLCAFEIIMVIEGCGFCCDPPPPNYNLSLFVEYSSDEAKNFVTDKRIVDGLATVERDSVFFFSLSEGKRSKISTSFWQNWEGDGLYFAVASDGGNIFKLFADKGGSTFYLKKMNNTIDTLQMNVVSRKEDRHTHYDLKDFKINGENATKAPFSRGESYCYWLRKP